MGQTVVFMVTEPKLYFFIPVTLYNGMSLGFMFADYTKYVISEGLGPDFVGFVMATFYGVNCLCSVLYGRESFLRKVSRRSLIVMAFVLHVAFFLFYFFFHQKVIGYTAADLSNYVPPKTVLPGDKPTFAAYASSYTSAGGHQTGKDWTVPPGHSPVTTFSYVMIFLGAVVFAVGDAVWESVIPPVIQGYFVPDGDAAVNKANANYKMWQSLGFAAQFAIGATFPEIDTSETVLQHFHLKVVILGLLLLVGGILAIVITMRHNPDRDDGAEDGQEGSKGLLDDPEVA